MKVRNLAVAIALLLGATAPHCFAQTISVAASCDRQFAFQDVAARFEKVSGEQVKLIFGSSGNFLAQIQNGAEIPEHDYPPIEQAAAILKSSLQRDTAREFLAFVKSTEILDWLKKSGFSVPANARHRPLSFYL